MSVESDFKKEEFSKGKPDFIAVSESKAFKNLIAKRKKFILPLTVFFLVFYFMLPILTSYSTILNTPVIGDISWAWIFAFCQFIMTWVFCTVYVKKSASFDRQSDEIVENQLGGRHE
ncbi:DUF485 domain-containing protein [Virgibacillus salarius]